MAELTPVQAEQQSFAERLARHMVDTGAEGAEAVFTCPECSDTTWKSVTVNGVARVTRCDCVHLHAEGVPLEFYAATFATYEQQDGNATALAKAKAFLQGGRDLFLCGGVGAGKTRLACTILNEANQRDGIGLFLRVPMTLYRLQPGTGLNDTERTTFEQRLFQAPLVVLDDIGAERDVATDFTRRMLLMIYEERGDRGHRTIWTSNKTPGEIQQMQDDTRLASRIAGRCDVVKLSTPDQRMARRK